MHWNDVPILFWNVNLLHLLPILLFSFLGRSHLLNPLPSGAIFELKIHRMRLRPGVCPGPQWGSFQHARTGFQGAALQQKRGGDKTGAEGRGGELKKITERHSTHLTHYKLQMTVLCDTVDEPVVRLCVLLQDL